MINSCIETNKKVKCTYQIRTQKGISLMLFLFAIVFYYFSVIKNDIEKSGLIEFLPSPDVIEYQYQTKQLIEDKAPKIKIGEEYLPSRYSTGWPSLCAIVGKTIPSIKTGDAIKKAEAPFITNKILGALLIIVSFLVFYYQGSYLYGGCLSILLSTLPGLSVFSKSGMSDLAGAIIIIATCVLIKQGEKNKSYYYVYLTAIILGVSLLIRSQLLFFSPCLLAIITIKPQTKRSWILPLFTVGLLFLVGSIPYFYYNYIEFGAPLKSGYNYWVSFFDNFSSVFSIKNIGENIKVLIEEILMTANYIKISHMSGVGTYIVSSYVLLSIIGLAQIKYTKATFSLLLGFALLLLSTITYFFHKDARLYFPLMCMLAFPAATASSNAIKNIINRKNKITNYSVIFIFLLSIFGYPSDTGYPPDKKPFTSSTIKELNWVKDNRIAVNYYSIQTLLEMAKNKKFLVLSDINPVYIAFFIPEEYIASPIDENNPYNLSKKWSFSKDKALALTNKCLEKGMSIYILQSIKCDQTHPNRYPNIKGYTWRQIGIIKELGTIVYELVKP